MGNLSFQTSEDGIEIGAGLTLTELMCLLHDYAHKSKSFDVIREHLEKVYIMQMALYHLE